MDSEQAFLLEVIVGKFEVLHKKKNEKSVGFEESTTLRGASGVDVDKSNAGGGTVPASSTPTAADETVSGLSIQTNPSVVTGMPSAPVLTAAKKQSDPNSASLANSPVKILAVFSDFPPMEIFEDASPDTIKEKREKAEELEKMDRNRTNEEQLAETKRKAKEAGLSLQEYRESQKMKAASRTLKKFKRGKSHLFRMKPTVLMKLVKDSPMVIHIHQDLKETVTTPSVGKVDVVFPDSFLDAIKTGAYYALMRDMIAREGHIYWPRSYYMRETRKRRREQAKQEAAEKCQYKCPESEANLYHRFQNLLGEPEPPAPCPVCVCFDDPCQPFPRVTFQSGQDTRRKTTSKRPVLSAARRRQIQLSEPSPEPIDLPKGPVVAELDDTFQLINDNGDEVAMINLFVRLSCFNNLLNMETLAA